MFTFYYGVDPGNKQSGFVVVGADRSVQETVTLDNHTLRTRLYNVGTMSGHVLCVEYMVPRGMPMAAEEMDTMYELGRIAEAWNGTVIKVPRHLVKSTLCGSGKAKDGNIRQAIIDLYGGEAVAIGGKKCQVCKGKKVRGRDKVTCEACQGSGYVTPPGPLAAVSMHAWQALATVLVGMGMEPSND